MTDFKRGDTWEFTGPLDFTPTNPANLTGWTIKSQGRKDDGTLVQEFQVEITDSVNRVIRHYAPATSTMVWPIGQMLIDVECIDPDGRVISTRTTKVQIVVDITRA
ncbi:MAG: hypothetical protein ACREUF_11520 [Solimonas sp.]